MKCKDICNIVYFKGGVSGIISLSGLCVCVARAPCSNFLTDFNRSVLKEVNEVQRAKYLSTLLTVAHLESDAVYPLSLHLVE